ncbi:hypothetical protein JOQ06_024795, partial [Pogonophryne albipinna]
MRVIVLQNLMSSGGFLKMLGRCAHFTNRYNNTTVVGVQCAVHSPEDVQLKETGRSSSSPAEGSSACASAAKQPPPSLSPALPAIVENPARKTQRLSNP